MVRSSEAVRPAKANPRREKRRDARVRGVMFDSRAAGFCLSNAEPPESSDLGIEIGSPAARLA